MGTTPRGWYDVGDGWAGMWDGEQWTGERISHQQLAALTRPPAPPPPMVPPPPAPRYPPATAASSKTGLPRALAIIGGIVVVFIGLAAAGNAADETGTAASRSNRTATTSSSSPFAAVEGELSRQCDSVETPRRSLLVGVPSDDPECARAASAALKALGFSVSDFDRALAGTTVRSGDMRLSVFAATDGLLIGVDAD